MNTFQNNYDSIEKLIFDEGLSIQSLKFNPGPKNMHVHLNHDIVFVVSLSFYKGLKNADLHSLNNYELIAKGTGIHWPELDEDLSLKGFFSDFLKQNVLSGKELVIA